MKRWALLFCVLISLTLNACGGDGGGSSADTVSSLVFDTGYDHSVVLKPDGTMLAWGRNSSKQCGIEGYGLYPIATPRKIGNRSDWIAIGAGGGQSSGVREDGTLWVWGRSAALGTNVPEPAQLNNDTDWRAVSAGSRHKVALKNDGTLWAWGDNTYSACGTDTGWDPVITPTQVYDDSDWMNISAGQGHNLALKNDGSLWAWGDNSLGQCGTVPVIDYYDTFGIPVYKPVIPPAQIGDASAWIDFSTGAHHSLAVKEDGSLWGWGLNVNGRVGVGSSEQTITSPTRIGVENDWMDVEGGYTHSIALKADGTLWAWGENYYGQCGTSTGTFYSSPMQVGTDSDWVRISAGHSHSLAMKNDGSLWVWGQNDFFQCGIYTGFSPSYLVEPLMLYLP